MKKLLTVLAVAVTLAVLALGVGSMRWRPWRRSGPPGLEQVARGAGPLLAGAAVVPLDLPGPVPVAGFPRLHWTDEGVRDPVAVRAIVLEEPGCRVALVSIEILLVPGALQRAIERKVRDLGLDGVVVAATHTHAGPGAFWDEPLGERIATGPYQERVFDLLVDRAATAVRTAFEARQPAYLSIGHGEAAALARNRNAGAVDGRIFVARLTALAGPEVATVVLYPAHATLLGVENRLVSGDWPGALMRSHAGPHAGPLLFFQGALGDQSPHFPPHVPATPEGYARALDARVEAVHGTPGDPWPDLAFARATAVLPAPIPGATPPLFRRIARNLFYDWVPARANVEAVRLGSAILLAVPAEPVTAVGRSWRDAAGPGTEILALAGDYLGYVETSQRMAETAGETVRTYYGPELAQRLAGALHVAADAVRGGATDAADAPSPPGDQKRNPATAAPRASIEP